MFQIFQFFLYSDKLTVCWCTYSLYIGYTGINSQKEWMINHVQTWRCEWCESLGMARTRLLYHMARRDFRPLSLPDHGNFRFAVAELMRLRVFKSIQAGSIQTQLLVENEALPVETCRVCVCIVFRKCIELKALKVQSDSGLPSRSLEGYGSYSTWLRPSDT